MNATALLEAFDVGVEIGGQWLVRDVTLAVRPGETITLMGPNGAGKTTLIRALLGLVRSHTGTVHRRANLRTGYVPATYAPLAHIPLTVSRFMSLTRKCKQETATAALEQTGACCDWDACLSELSRGELQRVLLARALAQDIDLLVLDEPLQGIDLNGVSDLYASIYAAARKRNIGVLMASHDLHDVLPHTDRLVCLDTCPVCDGAPQDVLEDPTFRALFEKHFAHCDYPETCAPHTHAG